MMPTLVDYTITLSDCGMPVFHDVACELAISTELTWSDFDFSVTAVIVNDVDLLRSHDPAFKRLGMLIAEQAEQDEKLSESVMAAENIVYVGAGYNDPSGHYEVEA